MSQSVSTTSRSRSTGSPPARGRPSTRRSATPGIGCTSGCSPLGSAAAKFSVSRGAPRVLTARWPTVRTRDRRGDHGCRQVRPSGLAGRPGLARVVGREPTVPHADVRPDPPSAPVAGDGGRYDVPLPRRAPADALEVARDAAAGQDVRIGGGPTMVRAFIAAGLVDHLHVVLVPILLGRGVRLWDGLEALEQQYDVEAVSTPSGVTHLTFTR